MPKESNFTIRLSKAAKELNVGKDSIVEFLAKKGFQIGSAPNTKISAELYSLPVKEFQGEKAVMDLAKRLGSFYYKGGGVSVESTIKTSKVTTDKRIEEKTNTICKKESRENCVPKVVERKDENKEISIENKEQTKVEYDVAFSELKFEQGYISLIYDKKYCIYRDYKIRDYNKILEKIYNRSKKGQEAIKASIIRVIIDIEEETFVFKDIDIRRYVNRLKDVFLPENKDAETLGKIQLSEVAKEINMDVSAIRKFLIKKGFQVDSSPNAKLTTEMYALLVKEKKEILISLSKLYFGPNYMSLKKGLLEFVLWEKGISPCLNSEKSIKNTSTKIFLDYSDLTFQFKDLSLLSKLKDLSAKLEKEKRIQEKEKTSPKKIQLGIPFSEFKFGQGVVSIIYKERQYVYRNTKPLWT